MHQLICRKCNADDFIWDDCYSDECVSGNTMAKSQEGALGIFRSYIYYMIIVRISMELLTHNEFGRYKLPFAIVN